MSKCGGHRDHHKWDAYKLMKFKLQELLQHHKITSSQYLEDEVKELIKLTEELNSRCYL